MDIYGKCGNCGHELCEGCERHRKTDKEIDEERRLEAVSKVAAGETVQQMLAEKKQVRREVEWTTKMAMSAEPEPPKIDSETEKRLQLQKDDLAKQFKMLEDMKAKEAENEAKLRELQAFINESKLRERNMKDDAERAEELARRLAEETATAKAIMEAVQLAKDIADLQARYRTVAAATVAAKAEAEKEVAEAAATAAFEAKLKTDADAFIAAETAKAEAELTAAQKEAEEKISAFEIASAEAKIPAKKEAEEKIAAFEVAAAEAKVPAKKAKPIKFKDALGRRFNFPYELCRTWKGMNDLICQAFAHVEPMGQMVADGNYDLIGPFGEIILPQIWETVLEPDWTVTMCMWPIKEVPTEKPPPPGMTMRHPIHPPGKRGGRAPTGPYSGRERGGPPPGPPTPSASIPGAPGWIGPLPGGGPKMLANTPRKKQGASSWGSLFRGTPKNDTKKKKNEDILHSAIPSRDNPQAPLQVSLALTHEMEEDDTLSSLLRRHRPLLSYSPFEERQRLSETPFESPQLAESSYPSVSEFRVTEYTKQRETEAERQKKSELGGAAIKPSDASFIKAVAHSDAGKKRTDVEHDQKAQHLGCEVESSDALLKPPASVSDGDNPEVEQPERAVNVPIPTETSDIPSAPAMINSTGDKSQLEAVEEKQAELVEDRDARDAPQKLLPPTDSNENEKRQVPRTEKQADHAGDDVEPSVAPPTPPASDSDGDKEHLAVWATPPPTHVPIEVVLPLPSEVPLPVSPPLTPARAITPPPALPPLSPASVQSPMSPFGPRLLYAGRDGARLYAPYQYEQVNRPHQERSPLSVVWSVVFCLSLGTISLVILTFGTTTALIDERTSSTSSTSTEAAHMPSIADPGFSLTLQSSLWAVTNLIAGLIPACMHATRYGKWLRMNYAWLPAIVCLIIVVASVPIYLRSPALSNGLAGVANIPMGLFIFFASWEAMREERHGKCGCGIKGASEADTTSSEESLSLRKEG